MCGACQEKCPVQIEHMQKIIDLGKVKFESELTFEKLNFVIRNNSRINLKLKNYKVEEWNGIFASAISAILVSRLTIGLIGDYLLVQYHNGGLQGFCSTVYFWICLGVLIGLQKILVLENSKKNRMVKPEQ